MKKRMFSVAVVFVALAVALVSGSCGSSPAATAKVDRPDWVLNPPQDDEKLFGMGAANSTNESRGWKMAENRARNSISYQITAIVEGMQEDYTRQAGTDDAETSLNFFQDVGRQLTANVLNGARIEKRGIGSNGTYYVLVSYSESAIKDAGSAAIQAAAKNAQISAENALQAMDAALAAKRTPGLVETGE
ncbi:MAG: LPP20 family lipoprotein [Treponema sp.]|jgi:hypothetical protein|nr:LPP20 family lipoprotein [Treponema sp.]